MAPSIKFSAIETYRPWLLPDVVLEQYMVGIATTNLKRMTWHRVFSGELQQFLIGGTGFQEQR